MANKETGMAALRRVFESMDKDNLEEFLMGLVGDPPEDVQEVLDQFGITANEVRVMGMNIYDAK